MGDRSEPERTPPPNTIEPLLTNNVRSQGTGFPDQKKLEETPMTTPLANGYIAKNYRYQAALNIQQVDFKLAEIAKSRTLNSDLLAALMEAQTYAKDALRWLEVDGAGTLPREING